MTAGTRPVVAVVGGGIAGLAAAWELCGGTAGDGALRPSVVVLEASPRLGGKLCTVEFCGGPVDAGPDGFLGRRPEALELCREVGLADELVPVAASGAAVWARGRRRPLPSALVLGVPTRVLPAARSGILSAGGVLRMATDLVAPRPDTRGPLGDRAIGSLVARKLGRQVVGRLVDPLVGGIHAGGVADASAAAVFPALLSAAQQGGSLMRALRRLGVQAEAGREEGAPLFWALRTGFESLVGHLAERLGGRGADIRVGQHVEAIDRDGARWALRTPEGTRVVDGVVVATPAAEASMLLAPHDPEAAGILRSLDYASVALVTMAFDDAAVPDDLYGTGLLVPHGTPVPRGAAPGGPTAGDGPCVVTACTYLSAKWPHLQRPGVRLLRASVGRAGDDRHRSMPDAELVTRVVHELRALVGITGEPVASRVTRWDEALPQYRVHHLLRVSSVEAAVRRLGGVAVAGAAYRGVGVPACIQSGRVAAREVVTQLASSAGAPGAAATSP